MGPASRDSGLQSHGGLLPREGSGRQSLQQYWRTLPQCAPDTLALTRSGRRARSWCAGGGGSVDESASGARACLCRRECVVLQWCVWTRARAVRVLVSADKHEWCAAAPWTRARTVPRPMGERRFCGRARVIRGPRASGGSVDESTSGARSTRSPVGEWWGEEVMIGRCGRIAFPSGREPPTHAIGEQVRTPVERPMMGRSRSTTGHRPSPSSAPIAVGRDDGDHVPLLYPTP